MVDSSGWLEFFSNGPNADDFVHVLGEPQNLIVPVVTLYKVFKRVLRQRDESAALEAAALMMQGRVVELDSSTALEAAKLGRTQASYGR